MTAVARDLAPAAPTAPRHPVAGGRASVGAFDGAMALALSGAAPRGGSTSAGSAGSAEGSNTRDGAGAPTSATEAGTPAPAPTPTHDDGARAGALAHGLGPEAVDSMPGEPVATAPVPAEPAEPAQPAEPAEPAVADTADSVQPAWGRSDDPAAVAALPTIPHVTTVPPSSAVPLVPASVPAPSERASAGAPAVDPATGRAMPAAATPTTTPSATATASATASIESANRRTPSAATAAAEPAVRTGPVASAPGGTPAPGVVPSVPAASVSPPVASPPASATPAAPALPAQIAAPLFSLAAAGRGEHVMTISVTPDNLGPVTVRAHVSGEGIRVELFAPNDIARDAVRAILPELRRDLAGAGLGGSLELSRDNGPANERDQQPDRSRDRAASPRPPEQDLAATAAGHRPAASTSASTIDVFA